MSRVQTPLKSWLFQASIHNCLNCVHNCDDHSSLDSKSAVQYMKHFIYHFTANTAGHETGKNDLWYVLLALFGKRTIHKESATRSVITELENYLNRPWDNLPSARRAAYYAELPDKYRKSPVKVKVGYRINEKCTCGQFQVARHIYENRKL